MLNKCALHDEKFQAGAASFWVPPLGDVRWSKILSPLLSVMERGIWLTTWISLRPSVSQLRNCVLHGDKGHTEEACLLPTLVLSTIKSASQICGSHIGSGTVKNYPIYVDWKSYTFYYGWFVPMREIFLPWGEKSLTVESVVMLIVR